MSGRSRRVEHSVDDRNGGITLADLRWLVDACADLDPKTPVTVVGAKDAGPRDRDPARIVVGGTATA